MLKMRMGPGLKALLFEGEPERHTRVRGFPNHLPREWSLYKATESDAYQ